MKGSPSVEATIPVLHPARAARVEYQAMLECGKHRIDQSQRCLDCGAHLWMIHAARDALRSSN